MKLSKVLQVLQETYNRYGDIDTLTPVDRYNVLMWELKSIDIELGCFEEDSKYYGDIPTDDTVFLIIK